MNAKGWSAAELDEEVLRALGSLAADPSAFVLLEGMTRLESPKSLTELSRTFAADPFDIEEALARLVSLRFVDQRGKAFAANESAAAVMHLIRETVAARNVEIPAVASKTLDRDVEFADAQADLPYAVTSTNNGAWRSTSVPRPADASGNYAVSKTSTSSPTRVGESSTPQSDAPPLYVDL